MKHIHTLLMTVLLSMSASAAGTEAVQTEPEARRTILGISLMPLQTGVMALEGERVVSPRVSVGLGLRAGLVRSGFRAEQPDGTVSSGIDETTRYLVGADPLVRFFLTGSAPEGLWVSPRLELTRQWVKGDNDEGPWVSTLEERQWSVGGAALVGYSTVVGRGLAVQAGVGLQAGYARGRTLYRNVPPAESGLESQEWRHRTRSWSVGERVALSVGWAF